MAAAKKRKRAQYVPMGHPLRRGDPARPAIIPRLIEQARGAKRLPPLKSVTALLAKAKRAKKKSTRLAKRTR